LVADTGSTSVPATVATFVKSPVVDGIAAIVTMAVARGATVPSAQIAPAHEP
jgi:hypothetical protein